MSVLSSKKCCVPGCLDSGGTKQTLHLFPNPEKDKERFNTWVYKIGGDIIGLENNDIYKLRRVCHVHFEEKYCCRYNRLGNVAVPTLKLPGPTSFPQYTHNERKPPGQIQNTDVAYVKDVEHNLFAKLQALPSFSKGKQAEQHTIAELQNLAKENFDKTPLSGKLGEETSLSGKAGEETSLSGEAVEDSSSSWQDSAVVPNETEDDPKPEFSWQQESAVVPCDDDHPERLPPPAPCLESPPHDAEGEKLALDLTNYRCNFCSNTITGFRYTCVQCADVDLCGACEARQAHHAHYVLRIPQNRPLAEVVARLRVIRQALLADAIVNVPGDLLEEVKEEQNQEDHADMVLCQGDDTDVEMYQEDPIDVIYPDQAELVKVGLAEKDPIDVNLDFNLSPSLGRKDPVKNDSLDCATEDDSTSDMDCSYEETFSKTLSKQSGSQLKPITIKRQAIRHNPTLSAVKPLRTSPAQIQAESVDEKLPVFIPTNPQLLFTIETTQSKSCKDKTVLRLTPISCPAVDPNRSIVTLDRIKPIIRNDAKEEPVSERLKPTFPVSRQTEIIQRNLITQRLGLEPISTANKRSPETSLSSSEMKKIRTHHETKWNLNSLQHMNSAVVRLQRLPPRCDATEQGRRAAH